MYLLLGAGLYLILSNSGKEKKEIELKKETEVTGSIELVETKKNLSVDEDNKKSEDEIEGKDEEEELLNK